ncbi:hypothetical protein T12_9337 [Trichinella patagoniensis]|uniref:Uncharacterized protein n=1 Tax=Trichinella patagoniensis TaxID=990121 RepID=A0A0V0ZYD5_9BILA|nr:hypothetical protein T12_9337 [Trichinella patagoniensis]
MHQDVAVLAIEWTAIVKATPQAMPQAIFRKFRNFSNIAPGFALRLRPRANKNLHIPSGYASGVLLHHICPQETATENSVKVADRKRLTYADMAKLGVAERAAGSASDAATVVNDAATVNDAADNASAVPGEDKARPAGSRPTSTASSRLSSRDVLKSS